MNVLVVCGALLLGVVLGFYAHKASLRIARWGEALREFDREVQLEYADFGMDDHAEPVRLEAVSEDVSQADFVAPIPVPR